MELPKESIDQLVNPTCGVNPEAGSEERLRLLIESTDNVVLLLDLGGRILYANPSSRYGVPGQDLIGKTPYDIFSKAGADRMMERVARVASTGKSLSVEDSVAWQGEQIWFHVQFYPVLTAAGDVGSVTVLAHEISDVKKAEMALREAQERLSNERLRMRIATDLHDEIGSVLSSVSIFAGLAKQAAGKEAPQVGSLLARVEENVQYVLDSLDDIIWTINPDNDTLDDIILRIRTHATEILEARGIKFDFSLQGQPEPQVVPLGKRRDFYLIFREALNNLARHSAASEAEISISIRDSVLTMVLRDNGRGFDTRKTTVGNGLQNMQKRAVTLGGKLDIESEPGKGSRVILTFEIT